MIDKKGVSTTLEYVMIFGISFVILTSSIVVVNQMEDRVIEKSSREKLEVIGNKIASKVVETYITHLMGDGYFTKELNVPSQVNGEDYMVTLEKDSVILETDNIRVSKKLFNLNESVELEGGHRSSEDLFVYYDGKNISLRASG